MINCNSKGAEAEFGCQKKSSNYVKVYCAHSNVHGVKYLGQSTRPLSEKLLWLFVITISLIFCGLVLHKAWHKWETSAITFGAIQESSDLSHIPFPAVTICSENKARQRTFNFTEAFHSEARFKDAENITEEEKEMLKFLQTVSLVCDSHLVNEGNKTGDSSIVKILEQVAPDFEEMMWQCKWNNIPGSCNDLFKKVVTDEGVCFTFNMLNSSELFKSENHDSSPSDDPTSQGWTLENGYPANVGVDTYPRRGRSSARSGLTILLRAFEYDLDYLCKGPTQGFKVLLHNPAETPDFSQRYIRVPLNQEVMISVKPRVSATSEEVRYYAANSRQCYYANERNLEFYKTYTQENCELECLTKYTLEKCGCVTFYMPRNTSTPICSSASRECVSDAQGELQTREITRGLNLNPSPSGQGCDCLASCSSIEYDTEISQTYFNWQRLFIAYKADFSELPGVTMSRVSIYFKENKYLTSYRSQGYSLTDFLATCGGLLGLFLGVSILSLVELIYFLTLRLLNNFVFKVTDEKEI